MSKENFSELEAAAGILYLEPSFCSFEKNGDFLSCTVKRDDEMHYSRVNIHRMFPYDTPYGYISVLNTDSEEIGIIRNIEDFKNDAELLRQELNRKYYVCRLTAIVSIRDRWGFSYWKALSDDAEISFTLRDTFNNIRRSGDGSIFITDIDSNSYVLPSVEALDSRSRKCIELYL